MSNIADMGLDLDNLFQPAWAQGKSEANRFDKFTGDEGVRPERRRSDRGEAGGRRVVRAAKAAAGNGAAAMAVRPEPAAGVRRPARADRAGTTAGMTAASPWNRSRRCRN